MLKVYFTPNWCNVILLGHRCSPESWIYYYLQKVPLRFAAIGSEMVFTSDWMVQNSSQLIDIVILEKPLVPPQCLLKSSKKIILLQQFAPLHSKLEISPVSFWDFNKIQKWLRKAPQTGWFCSSCTVVEIHDLREGICASESIFSFSPIFLVSIWSHSISCV